MFGRSVTALALALTAAAAAVTSVRGHVAATAQGALRGVASDDGSHVSYRAVPYAGDAAARRFKKAPPAPSWQGIRDARREGGACLAAVGGAALGDDDCLTLDVHAPLPPAALPRPVLVWLLSEPTPLRPHRLLRRGIILVAVNYRVGPLGFVCAGREAAPGNAGAKDALLALRWVRDNAAAFGGDAARVTLAGRGRGAAVAEALLLSPAARGLVRGAILQGGSALAPWAFNHDAELRATALAKHLTNGSAGVDMTKLLLDARPEKLVSKSRLIDFPYFPFGLCAEKQFKKEERLLDADPMEILTKRRFEGVPLLIGSTSDEAVALAPTLIRARASRKARRDFSLLLPEGLRFVSEGEWRAVAERVRKEYFPEGNFSMGRLLEYYTDAYFGCHVRRSAALHAAASDRPTYLYELGADTDLFGSERTVDEGERTLQELMTTLWANFIEHGNPTPPAQTPPLAAWEAWRGGGGSGATRRPYALGARAAAAEAEGEVATRERRTVLWEDVYDKYYYRRLRNL